MHKDTGHTYLNRGLIIGTNAVNLVHATHSLAINKTNPSSNLDVGGDCLISSTFIAGGNYTLTSMGAQKVGVNVQYAQRSLDVNGTTSISGSLKVDTNFDSFVGSRLPYRA